MDAAWEPGVDATAPREAHRLQHRIARGAAGPHAALLLLLMLLAVVVSPSHCVDAGMHTRMAGTAEAQHIGSAGSSSSQSSSISKFDSSSIPWLQRENANIGMYKAIAHNNLERLMKGQAKGMRGEKWVSIFTFNRAVTHWALNCIYSYIKYGKARNYIVATFDEASLQSCLDHRLPCYNATHILGPAQGAQLADRTLHIKSAEYLTMVWAKVVVMQEVLRLGYHVHFSDVDVVYMRPVWQSYKQLFARHRADAIFMKESVLREDSEDAEAQHGGVAPRTALAGQQVQQLQGHGEAGGSASVNLFNTGIYAMRSNNATLQLVEKWLAARDATSNDQVILNSLAYKEYVVCSGPAQCMSAKLAGWATIFRHPSQFGAMGVCPSKFDVPCDPVRLFLHAICRSGWDEGNASKGRVLTKYRLWLVDAQGQPLYNEDHGDGRHPFLPCAGPAWTSAAAA